MSSSSFFQQDKRDCGAPCHAMFFPEKERTVLRYWVGSWAAVCVASCLFTVLTFLIDSSRFRYPERAIVFLAVCYLVVGCAYVAGLGAGDSVACREPFPPPVRLGRLQMMSTITQGHRQSTACTVLFMALYFCCMAAFAWWSCLAFAWFLAAGLKWGHEAIENKSHLFHLVAWAIPALQTISVLALAKVEVCTWYEFVRGATASQTAWNINSVFGSGVTTHWLAIFRIGNFNLTNPQNSIRIEGQ
uniref:G-protein coupled receptors family 2 profile 2 domain-containing protein n=1 Tax=Glossina palpalis gambiensis TaxID=67801 RepID=A0A1B0AW34_9MUSC